MASTASDIRVPRSSASVYVKSPIIRVVVGEAACDFFAHEGLICPRSDFFHKAMNGPWKEAGERMVPLPEDEVEICSLYLDLLYTNQLPTIDASTEETDSTTVADEYATLSKLFVLAEKLMDDQAKAAVLAAISARSKEPFSDGELYYPAIDSVQIIYEGTLEDSSARKLLVELYTNFVVCAFVTEKSEAVPKDFLQDLALSLLVNRPLPKIEDLKEQINAGKGEVCRFKVQKDAPTRESSPLPSPDSPSTQFWSFNAIHTRRSSDASIVLF